MNNPVYRNTERSVSARVYDLLSRMTLAEKVAQLTSVWLTLDPAGGDFAPYQGMLSMSAGDLKPVLEHGIGHISRPLGSRPISPRDGAAAVNAFQKALIETTRLGIPAIVHEECLTGLTTEGATQFPSPLNYGATWNPDLIRMVGDSIRQHMRSIGAHQGLAPVADVIRDARWGRVEECVAEDPLLVGAIISAFVQGLQGSVQGSNMNTGVIATLKHFCGYSGSEGGRNFAPTHVGPREMRDLYLLPFEMAVRMGGAKSVMNSYQENDGVPTAASRFLLTEVLRNEWGFSGTVVADYYAVRMLQSLHLVASDAAQASAIALNAGLDIELPLPHCYWQGIPLAIESGLLSMATVDASVSRILKQKFELGLFENPYVDETTVSVNSEAARALSKKVAAESLTLLKNDGVLPLKTTVQKLAVIGPNANDAWAVFGNYSYHNHIASHFPDRQPPDLKASLLDELRARFDANNIVYAEGCRIQTVPFPNINLKPSEKGLFVESENISHDRAGIAAAVDAAKEADTVVLVLGDRAGHFRTGSVGEGSDAADLKLPGVQAELADAVLAVGKPTIVVLIAGRPPVLGDIVDRAAAIVMAWFPGLEGAAAIVNLLVGDAEPSGRLTVSMPRSTGAMPYSYNHKPLARGVPSQPMFDPAYPFGHGLTYTTFAWSDFAMSATEMAVDGVTEISITVRNIGEREGCEVVQLYVRDMVATVTRPVLELKGFQRVVLAPKQAARISFKLHADVLAFTGMDGHTLRIEPGVSFIAVGASSADLRSTGQLTLTSPTGAVRTIQQRQHFLADAFVSVID